MPDQIIDAGAAQGLQAYADRAFPMVGWVVMRGLPAYSDKVVARLVTADQTAYVLIGDTLAEVQEQLPSGLERTLRQPSDPPEVVEVWFSP
jgi:hypothetical protein